MSRLLFAAVILAIAAADASAAPKTDIVELLNGDRITCEIKKLDRGKITVKTDGVGTIAIEWNDVARLTSAAYYDLEFTSGRHVYGSLEPGSAPGMVSVVSVTDIAEDFALAEIVRLTPLGRTFWRRLDGAIDAGFSFTEANVQTQWTFHANVSHRTRQTFTNITGDSALTLREDADRQLRNSLTAGTQRFLRPRLSLIGFAQFQQNDELSLQLRSSLGVGAVRVLVQSNRTELALIAGAAFTNEQYEGDDRVQVAEAVAGGLWDFFTFDGRSMSLDVTALSFYTLSSDSRIRLELNTSFKSDIVGDLYWSINLFESFNSDPPQSQKKNDFGVSATVGWSF